MTNEQKTEAPENGVLGGDGIFRTFDEHYDNMQDVEQDPYGAWLAIQHLSQQNQAATGAVVKRCAEVLNSGISGIQSDEFMGAIKKDGLSPDIANALVLLLEGAQTAILATAPEAVKAFEEHEARHKAELAEMGAEIARLREALERVAQASDYYGRESSDHERMDLAYAHQSTSRLARAALEAE